jgi:hypothetical protein
MKFKTVVKSLLGPKDPINRQRVGSELLAFRLEDMLFTDNDHVGQEWFHFYFVNGGSLKSNSATITLADSTFDYAKRTSETDDKGYVLLLSPQFFPDSIFKKSQDLSFMTVIGSKSFLLNEDQNRYLTNLFDRIIDEFSSNYRHKNELLAILMMQVVHFMVKNFGTAAEINFIS